MESNAWCPRLTAWIILSGSAVHVKGFGSALCSTTKRLIAACKSTTDRKMPRFNRRFVSLAKKPSTALSQDADVGVKWKVQRGCRANQIAFVLVKFLDRVHYRIPAVGVEPPPPLVQAASRGGARVLRIERQQHELFRSVRFQQPDGLIGKWPPVAHRHHHARVAFRPQHRF